MHRAYARAFRPRGWNDRPEERVPSAEVILHRDDEDLYYGLPSQPLFLGIGPEQAAALGFSYATPPKLTRNWEDGETYKLGDLRFEVRHCPGHTRGHIVLIEFAKRAVFVGDCLFEGSIGRTDLPGGSSEQLLRSITEQILSLDDDFTVYSGHGRRLPSAANDRPIRFSMAHMKPAAAVSFELVSYRFSLSG